MAVLGAMVVIILELHHLGSNRTIPTDDWGTQNQLRRLVEVEQNNNSVLHDIRRNQP